MRLFSFPLYSEQIQPMKTAYSAGASAAAEASFDFFIEQKSGPHMVQKSAFSPSRPAAFILAECTLRVFRDQATG